MNAAAPADAKSGPELRPDAQFTRALTPACLSRLERAYKKQWKRYRKKLKGCQERFSAEAIHDFRIEARRLLSVAELESGFVPRALLRKVERAVKRHLDTFDDLRDTHVQMALVEKMQRRFAGAVPFYEYLCRREKRLVRSTGKDIKRARIRRLGKLLTAWRAEVKARRSNCSRERTAALLLRAVDRAFAVACRRRARIKPRATTTIHRTRIAFKKFRYMLETLAGQVAAPRSKLLRAMRDYQTMMGDIQDAEVVQDALLKFERKHPREAEALEQLRGALLLRRERLIAAYLDAADELFRFWPPAQERAADHAAPPANTKPSP